MQCLCLYPRCKLDISLCVFMFSATSLILWLYYLWSRLLSSVRPDIFAMNPI